MTDDPSGPDSKALRAIARERAAEAVDVSLLTAGVEIEPVLEVPEAWRPPAKPRKHRGGRPLKPIPAKLRKQLELRFDHPDDERYTQEAIAERLGIDRGVVRRAEKRMKPS